VITTVLSEDFCDLSQFLQAYSKEHLDYIWPVSFTTSSPVHCLPLRDVWDSTVPINVCPLVRKGKVPQWKFKLNKQYSSCSRNLGLRRPYAKG
jgi:hypothetical protein